MGKLIYIASIDGVITLSKFKRLMYKEGHVYMINKSLMHKCVGYDKYNKPIVETLVVLDNINGRNTQIIRYVGSTDNGIPSLDFVNGRLSGKIKEIKPSMYDEIIDELNECSKHMSNKLKKEYGE